MEQPERILFFDGVCNLCNRLVQFIIRHDRHAKIRFSALQSYYGVKISVDPALANANSVIYLTEGRYYLKSEAILRMFRDMGRGWKLLYGFIIVPRFLRDYIYDLVARTRYRIFGKRDSCMVPSPDIRDRFLQ